MRYSFIVIGAHTGGNLEELIDDAVKYGSVLLVEPVPHLFRQLKEKYVNSERVKVCNCAVSNKTGRVKFYAPRSTANQVVGYGDQIGSLIADHAARCEKSLEDHIDVIEVDALSFSDLLDVNDVSEVGVLMTDMEGVDVSVLSEFPFGRLKPRQILFEYKHADGVNRIGSIFADFIKTLSNKNYVLRILDSENCLALLDEEVDVGAVTYQIAWQKLENGKEVIRRTLLGRVVYNITPPIFMPYVLSLRAFLKKRKS